MKYSIPSIDISPLVGRAASVQERESIASDVANALEHVGSFYVEGSGINGEMIEEWLNTSRQVFKLPKTVKSTLRPDTDSFEQGYTAEGEETSHGQPWHRESFGICRPRDDDGSRWPREHLLSHFREPATRMHERLKVLSDQLLGCVSIALGMEEVWLGEQHKGSLTTLHLNHYPEVSRNLLETGEYSRTGTHLDLDTLTFFIQDSVGGLEVAHLSSTGEERTRGVQATAQFIPISPSAGSILVSGGHMLARWSNGVWRGGVHRVSASTATADAMCPERYSLTFHVFPDHHVFVQPLKKYVEAVGRQKYKRIGAGAFLLGRRTQIYSKT